FRIRSKAFKERFVIPPPFLPPPNRVRFWWGSLGGLDEMDTQDIKIIPRLETAQTQRLRDEFPPIEYLESDYVADWLKVRKDQLLELAKEERSGCNLAKTLSIVCGFAGFIFHATSPIAPIGAICGIGAYLWSMYKDVDSTGAFSPIPFVRGNFLEVVGNVGNADLRQDYLNNRDGFEELKTHLALREQEEYLMLKSHLHTVTDYLMQVPALKRFHAYGWILDNYISLKGAFPSIEQVSKHVAKVAEDHVRVDRQVITAIKERALPPQPLTLAIPVIKELPKPNIQDSVNIQDSETEVGSTNVSTVIQDPTTVLQTVRISPQPQSYVAKNPEREVGSNSSPNLSQLKSLPLHERAIAVINLLKKSGFNVAECVRKQSNVVCGNQRGGKGTLVGILCILYQALDANTKINYFTAGADLYPFQCKRIVSAIDYAYSPNPNAKVASEFMKYLREIEKELTRPEGIGARKGEVLVLDEAIALAGDQTDEDLQWMSKFLMTRFSKSGSKLFIVLHASNLSSWIGSKNTAGISRTFKSDFSFIGCVATTIKINALDTIQVATGEYFIANPDSWGEKMPDGELGKIPDWLTTEINPSTGMPDPVRTLLTIFPEIAEKSVEKSEVGNSVSTTSNVPVPKPTVIITEETELEEEEVREVVLGSKTVQPVQGIELGSSISSRVIQKLEPLQDRGSKVITSDGSDSLDSSEPSSALKNPIYTPLNLSEPQLRGMIEILSTRMNQTEIIEHLWGVTKGGSEGYKQARSEFMYVKGVSSSVSPE
ncbi:MAG: hypothetical protein V7L23_15470, partial [Nostoc sp.]|uniref:hypothetical protein n=1 Tax=Nostoc sp. TaxID=1180 RepID=UPI002FF38051